MKEKINKLNIIMIALFAINTFLFKIKENIVDLFFFMFPIDNTTFLIVIDYLSFIFLIINVLLIIFLQIKNKKISLTKLNMIVLVIFGISIIFTTPYSYLYEIKDNTEDENANYYGQTLYLGKTFTLRKYYEYNNGEKGATLETQYIYLPVINKMLLIDNTPHGDLTITLFDIEYDKNFVKISSKGSNNDIENAYHKKKIMDN